MVTDFWPNGLVDQSTTDSRRKKAVAGQANYAVFPASRWEWILECCERKPWHPTAEVFSVSMASGLDEVRSCCRAKFDCIEVVGSTSRIRAGWEIGKE